MTTKDKVARRKLSKLEPAAELNKVSKACHTMGYSRQQFYEIQRNYQTYGAEGLIDRLLRLEKATSERKIELNDEQISPFELSMGSTTGHGLHPANFPMCYGCEYCDRPDRLPYELFLQLEEIEHHTTRWRQGGSCRLVSQLHCGEATGLRVSRSGAPPVQAALTPPLRAAGSDPRKPHAVRLRAPWPVRSPRP